MLWRPQDSVERPEASLSASLLSASLPAPSSARSIALSAFFCFLLFAFLFFLSFFLLALSRSLCFFLFSLSFFEAFRTLASAAAIADCSARRAAAAGSKLGPGTLGRWLTAAWPAADRGAGGAGPTARL